MEISPVQLVAALFSGGAFGAVLTELFRRRRDRLQGILLIEQVNRDVLQDDLKGLKLVRVAGDTEVKSLRYYLFTLQNPSSHFLRDAEFQIEFDAGHVEPWASRPVKGSLPLIQAFSTSPAGPRQVVCWRIPQFPPGDSVNLGFQVIDPRVPDYTCSLKTDENVILHRASEPAAPDWSLWTAFGLLLMSCLAFVYLFHPWRTTTQSRRLEELTSTAPVQLRRSEQIATVTDALRVARLFEFTEIYSNPGRFKRAMLAAGWVPDSEAAAQIEYNVKMLQSRRQRVGRHVWLQQMHVLAFDEHGDSADVTTEEHWTIPIMSGNSALRLSRDLVKVGTYSLKKRTGKWLIEKADNVLWLER